MRTSVALVLGLAAFAGICRAEPRWCSVSGSDPSNKILHPPIARAARVSGVVLMHMIYAPNGKVERTEPIFGPAMLSRSLTDQLMRWTVKTDAIGNDLCQTLVIVDFSFVDAGTTVQPATPLPSVLRISVQAEILVLIDPGGELSPFHRFTWRLKHLFHRSH